MSRILSGFTEKTQSDLKKMPQQWRALHCKIWSVNKLVILPLLPSCWGRLLFTLEWSTCVINPNWDAPTFRKLSETVVFILNGLFPQEAKHYIKTFARYNEMYWGYEGILQVSVGVSFELGNNFLFSGKTLVSELLQISELSHLASLLTNEWFTFMYWECIGFRVRKGACSITNLCITQTWSRYIPICFITSPIHPFIPWLIETYLSGTPVLGGHLGLPRERIHIFGTWFI